MPNEIESIKPEVRAAAEWFVTQVISKQGLSSEQLSKLQSALQQTLEAKYAGHWYADQPWRGNAFRSVGFDRRTNHLDNAVIRAGEMVGITEFSSRIMPIYTSFTIWVDPGEVSVRYSAGGGKHETTLTVYSRNNPTAVGAISAPQLVPSSSSPPPSPLAGYQAYSPIPPPGLFTPPPMNTALSSSPYQSPKILSRTPYVRYASPYPEADSYRAFLRTNKQELRDRKSVV